MIQELLQLIILFSVLLDPIASFSVFSVSVKDHPLSVKRKIAIISVLVAGTISFIVLIIGDSLLNLFSTTIDDFKIAGGIILIILGINMTLGKSVSKNDVSGKEDASAIASIIGSPILAGPATISTIIIAKQVYDPLLTGLALSVVLIVTGILFYFSEVINQYLGQSALRIMSSIMGLVTVSWGVKFIREGIISYSEVFTSIL